MTIYTSDECDFSFISNVMQAENENESDTKKNDLWLKNRTLRWENIDIGIKTKVKEIKAYIYISANNNAKRWLNFLICLSLNDMLWVSTDIVFHKLLIDPNYPSMK